MGGLCGILGREREKWRGGRGGEVVAGAGGQMDGGSFFATSGCSLPFILLIIISKFLSEQGWTPNEESSPGFMSA